MIRRLLAPATLGISPAGVNEFITAAAKNGHELHSLMIVRQGQVVVEIWWAPYRADAIHSLYSLSKSFTSTAVGFAVAEGRLSLDDQVIAFFPDKTPTILTENLASLQVKHLLTMSDGHSSEPPIKTAEDCVRTFLSAPIGYAPGTVFRYSSASTYMLSAIIQKVSGQKLVDYLESRFFVPLAIPEKKWETCPMGINTGGWGLSLTTEAVAKFGQFYLQNGQWNGKQLLPQSWIQDATSLKILRQPAASDERPDWNQGYGYQFWLNSHGGFRGDGAYGQFCIVLPEQDAVIAITSHTSELQGLVSLVWEHLLPALHNRPLSQTSAQSPLECELSSLMLPFPAGVSAAVRMDLNRVFKLEANSINLDRVAFCFHDKACTLTFGTGESTSEIRCGFEQWIDSAIDSAKTSAKFMPIPKSIGLIDSDQIKVAAAGAWRDEKTLEMHWRFYEAPHHDIVTCRFDGDQVSIRFLNSIVQSSAGQIAEARPMLLGRAST